LLVDDYEVWVNEDEGRGKGEHTFGRSVVIFVRVNRLVLLVPIVHPVVVVTTDTIIDDEIVLGKTTLDDALVLFLGHLIIEFCDFLLGPRPAATFACTLEFRELIEFGFLFAFGAVSHSRRWSRLGEGC